MKYSLGEICSFISGTVFPRESQNSLNGTIPFIKVSDLNTSGNERWIDYSNNYISESEAKKLRAKIHTPLVTTFAKIGIALTFNRRRLLRKKTIVDNNLASAVPNTSIIDPIFFYYLLSTIDFNKISSGTALPYLNFSDIERIPVDIPPIPTQRRIAEILSSLDDKIELNRQTNATLEAIAQAIFKEWFVDFNFPGATGEMVESEFGMIPKGWRVGKLGEVCKLSKGVSYKSSELQPSDSALVTLKSINRGGGFNNDGFKEYLGNFKTSQCLVKGDLIFAQTDITQNADVIGSPAIVENPFDYENLVASLDIVKCEPTNEIPSSGTLYYFLQRQEFKDYCLSQTNGSTVLHLRSSEIPNYSMIIPNSSILREFDSIITSIRQIILENNQQNHILRKTCDELLPKLMSGEIEV